jgi:hypothetical protein
MHRIMVPQLDDTTMSKVRPRCLLTTPIKLCLARNPLDFIDIHRLSSPVGYPWIYPVGLDIQLDDPLSKSTG